MSFAKGRVELLADLANAFARRADDRPDEAGRWTVELGTKLVRKITARDSPEAPGDGEGVADGGIAKP